jgi:hypothetical protein
MLIAMIFSSGKFLVSVEKHRRSWKRIEHKAE